MTAALLALLTLASSGAQQPEATAASQDSAPRPATRSGAAAPNSADNLLGIRRIYVEELKGGPQSDALRQLIISSIDATKLFVLTDNPDRADAILKGAADDHPFTDTFDSDESLNDRENGGKSGTGSSSSLARSGGLYGGLSIGENESHHIKERKHEAYASVRLCNLDGDVVWSTTQESTGAKFRGASADVAAKIARQLTLDVDKAKRGAAIVTRSPAGETP